MPSGHEPTTHSFESQRSLLRYVDWGNADAPTLLLIHGSRDHARSWDWTAEALRQKWHVIAFDMRGHGDSSWSAEGRYDFATYLYDLTELVRHLGDKPVAIVGHSLGSHVALRFAGLYPDKVTKLVAVEAVGAPPGIEAARMELPEAELMRVWIAERQRAWRAPRRYASLEEATARMAAENPRLSAEQARHLTCHGAVQDAEGGWRWKFDTQLRVWPFPDIPQSEVESLWRAITCPVLLIYGRESWDSPVPALLSQAQPGAKVVELEGAGHWPHHDRLDAFIAEVRAFLDG